MAVKPFGYLAEQATQTSRRAKRHEAKQQEAIDVGFDGITFTGKSLLAAVLDRLERNPKVFDPSQPGVSCLLGLMRSECPPREIVCQAIWEVEGLTRRPFVEWSDNASLAEIAGVLRTAIGRARAA